jgi:hypothetical protein
MKSIAIVLYFFVTSDFFAARIKTEPSQNRILNSRFWNFKIYGKTLSKARPMPNSDDPDSPLMPAGQAAGPGDSQRLIRLGGAVVAQCVELTGKDVFEYTLLYCLRLLEQAGGKICAFYLDDFDGCDEYAMQVIQKLIGRSGYTTSDFRPAPEKTYKGFWAWRTKAK